MKKIYTGVDSNSPSRTIFFKFQLPIILKTGKYTLVNNIKESDIIIIPNSKKEINKILTDEYYNFIKENRINIFIVKPHFERDIRFRFKTILGKAKSFINRFRLIEDDYQIPKNLKRLNAILISDSRRLNRTFKTQGWNTFYLPLTYFEASKYTKLKEIKFIKNREIIYMGEITHFIEWIKNIKFLINQKEFLNYKLRLFAFGAFYKKSVEDFIGVDRIIWDYFEFDFDVMRSKTENAIFALVPHNLSDSKYKPSFKNSLNLLANQPNEVKICEKFSANSGRNHLMSSLGIPFITSPSEDVLIEFNNYPFELFIENKDQMYFAAKQLINEEFRQELSKQLINQYKNNYEPKFGMLKLEKLF